MAKKIAKEKQGEDKSKIAKVEQTMHGLGYQDYVIYATDSKSCFTLFNIPFHQLLRLRARLDKIILENTE